MRKVTVTGREQEDREGWSLREATALQIEQLMTWFDTREATTLWGGPKFRFPFSIASFHEDCHWPEMRSFALSGPDGSFSAFGQIYDRNERIHLARVAVRPDLRGQGVGKRLLENLLEIGPAILERDEYSLFVYRHNTAALECYRSVGFQVQAYPSDQILADECYFLTRQVE